MAYLTFTHAGMHFRVEADINSDGDLEYIYDPHIWNSKKRQYEPISCDLNAFQDGVEYELTQAVEEYNINKKLFFEDLAYEMQREDKFFNKKTTKIGE